MSPNLAHLVADYQAAVQQALALLVDAGIPLPPSNTAWVGTEIPQRGQLANGASYFKHGYGCAVRFSEHAVDFDFGKNGETNGFDAWRLAAFAGDRLARYGFAGEAALKDSFQTAVNNGELVYSGYILYYVTPSRD
jgi:hypothetical protein